MSYNKEVDTKSTRHLERVMKTYTLTQKEFDERGNEVAKDLFTEAFKELRRHGVDTSEGYKVHVYDASIGKEIVVEVYFKK